MDDILSELGLPNGEIEQIAVAEQAIFWSFDLQNYRKSPWWSRTAQTPLNETITIRTAGTIKKLSTL